MKTITEQLRARLEKRLGIADRVEIETAAKRDNNKIMANAKAMIRALERMTDLARSRMIMGSIRYFNGQHKTHEAVVSRMQAKIDTYIETGNAEMLVDLLNYCVIEFQYGHHPNFHFETVDRKE